MKFEYSTSLSNNTKGKLTKRPLVALELIGKTQNINASLNVNDNLHNLCEMFLAEIANARHLPASPEFEGRFSHLRFQLIRSGRLQALDSILQALLRKAISIGDERWLQLSQLLLKHNAWHSGDFRSLDDLLTTVSAKSDCYLLSRLFAGYYLNTAGYFSESFEVFTELLNTPSSKFKNESFHIGCDVKCACIEWRFWNRNEHLALIDDLESDLIFVQSVIDGQHVCDTKSKTRILLAVGVFFLSYYNYAASKFFLSLAFRVSSGERSQWYARIASGLSICEYYLGSHVRSFSFLQDAERRLDSHFGPAGWQLRVAYSHYLHGNKERANALCESIMRQTQQKKELGYFVWASIYRLEFTGALTQWALIEKILEGCKAGQMTRAQSYALERLQLLGCKN